MRRVFVRLWLAALVCGTVVSCGSRTGLFGDGPGPDDSGGTGTGTKDSGRETSLDGDLDALPPIDVAPRPDVDRTDCPDADATFIYVVTQQDELFSFYPPTLTFTFVGRVVCPVADATPFSMAVDRKGAAYVLYNDGELFRVSTATAACIPTSYGVDQLGFHTFGMGFASDNLGGPNEQLYVAENNFSGDSQGLGTIDVKAFKLGFVGGFHPAIPRAELTGTGDGRLFAFWPDQPGPTGSHIAEIEKGTAAVIARTDLPTGRPNDAFAFSFWGGEFWIFTSPGGATEVTRFRPGGAAALATTHPSTIVGAGVSTCAPER